MFNQFSEDGDRWLETDESVEILAATDKAILVKFENDEEVWTPRSVLHDNNQANDVGDRELLTIKEWFGKKEGLW